MRPRINPKNKRTERFFAILEDPIFWGKFCKYADERLLYALRMNRSRRMLPRRERIWWFAEQYKDLTDDPREVSQIVKRLLQDDPSLIF